MNTKSARMSTGRLIYSLMLSLCLSGASSQAREDEMPEWITSPKSSDNMYVYAVGHSKYQPSPSDAQESAMKDAKMKLVNQISGFAGDLPVSKLRGVELMPGCVHVVKYRRDYECWIQVSYPVSEKNKLLKQMEEQEDSGNASVKPEQPARRESSGGSGDAGGEVMFMKDDSGSNSGRSSERSKRGKSEGYEKPVSQDSGSGSPVSAGKSRGGTGGGGGGASGTYPAEPFNGLQLRYSISGATLGKAEDKDGFTCVRSYQGKLGAAGSELVVSGSSSDINGVVNTEYGNFAKICDVEVWVGKNKKSFHSKRPHEEGQGKEKNANINHGPAYFELTIPIEEDSPSGGFRIEMTYVNPRFGDRGLVVCGTLDGKDGAPGVSGQNSKDPSTKETYTGDPNPQSDEEKAAWALYRRYKAGRKKIDDLKAGVSNKTKDLNTINYGFGAPFAVDKTDVKEKVELREKLAEAEEQLKMIQELWDAKFSGYYGSLSESDQTIQTTYFDPNKPLEMQTASMDLIEFRLRSFHNLKKAQGNVQKQRDE